MTTSIVIIDDHLMFRQGIAEMCAMEPDLDVIGQADNGDHGVTIVAQRNPDVVLLDVEMPGPDVEEVIDGIQHASAVSKIAVLTINEDAELVSRLIDAGVHAYISKGSSFVELVAAIRAIVSGRDRAVLCVSLAVASNLRDIDRGVLSARELEVLSLVSEGYGNAQIAGQLYISEGTVKRHLTNIYTKLGVRSRVNAINKAKHMGLLRQVSGTLSHPGKKPLKARR